MEETDELKLRFANIEDVKVILDFIKELADYEGLLGEVVATEEVLYESLFVKHAAEVVIAEYQNEAVGFALFFHNFSTFLGKHGLYLEDLYVKPEMRGKGFGKRIFSFLGKVAKERGCDRIDWWCLDWNKASIDFYEGLGAKAMSEWTVYRLTGDKIESLAESM